MALIDCVECGKEISDTTGGHCHHCGYNPSVAKPGQLTMGDGATLFFMLMIFGMFGIPVLLLDGMSIDTLLWGVIVVVVGGFLASFVYIYKENTRERKKKE